MAYFRTGDLVARHEGRDFLQIMNRPKRYILAGTALREQKKASL